MLLQRFDEFAYSWQWELSIFATAQNSYQDCLFYDSGSGRTGTFVVIREQNFRASGERKTGISGGMSPQLVLGRLPMES